MAPQSFANAIMADGPVGYWRLAETTLSAHAFDTSTAHLNNGTYSASGIILGQPGFHGGDTAALFHGTTGRIEVPNSASNNPARITMEAKVRWDGPTWAGPNPIQQRILEKESYAHTTQYGLSITSKRQVHVEIRTRNPTSSLIADSGQALVAIGAETH